MRRNEPIHKVELKSGRVRYRFVVDVGRKPNGRRDQRTYTYDTLREAREERAKIMSDLARGTFVCTTKKTLGEHLEEWLTGRRTIKSSTLANYRTALKPVIEQLGHLRLQELTKAHVDALVSGMLAGGRRVGTPGLPLSPSTVLLALTVLAMALDDAMRQGMLVRNVARLVDRPRQVKHEMNTWTAEQASAFLAFTAEDRLSVGWQISLYGLRRGEVLGLRWCDLDLDEGTLTVAVTRVIVEGQVVHGEPKSERGKRTLPLDAPTVAGLKRLRARTAGERLKAGSAYTLACPDCGEAHLFVDELGDPVHPESYSDRFEVLVRRAGLPAIRLHDTRHTCGTLMHLRHVPPAVIAAWLGHANASFTIATYVHSQDPALRAAGATLGAAYAGSEAPSKAM